MKLTLGSFLALLAAAGINAQTLMINTPQNVVECQPILLTWAGGSGPYFITFNNVTGTSLTWLVNQPAGTSLGLTIRDQTGTTEESASFQVQDGTTGCISSTLSFSAATTSGAATGSPVSTTGASTGSSGSSTASAGSSGASTGSSGSSTATSGSTTTAAGSSTTSSSAAMKPFAQIGSAGVIGAALVALFA
ncbi:hypothetical protein M0805_002387 [Coniferiporia weirii]|nr:hypothetical protein M0805_002387 [Coniferiporia weirii]